MYSKTTGQYTISLAHQLTLDVPKGAPKEPARVLWFQNSNHIATSSSSSEGWQILKKSKPMFELFVTSSMIRV